MTNRNAVGWFEIYVENMKQAVTFYQNVFDKTLETIVDPTGETEMMGFPTEMNQYGAGGALVKAEYAAPGVGGTLVYFSSEECSVEESRVEKEGGKVIRPKFSIGEFGWVSLCQDTEGNMFGLHSMK
jgi:predicted enzyme related to lactoylglutathione lyase